MVLHVGIGNLHGPHNALDHGCAIEAMNESQKTKPEVHGNESRIRAGIGFYEFTPSGMVKGSTTPAGFLEHFFNWVLSVSRMHFDALMGGAFFYRMSAFVSSRARIRSWSTKTGFFNSRFALLLILGFLCLAPTSFAGLVAEYRFDEAGEYAGSSGEVIDTSGNMRHGRVVGGASSAIRGRTCLGLNSPIEYGGRLQRAGHWG